jgi:hypothetical protein
MQTTKKLRPGDVVEVKAPEEILRTLDADGTLDRLPFMPEMVEFCGRTFQVSKRVVKTCYYTKAGSSGMRKFRTDDVVLLDGLRCSGAEHGGCQKACMIFWREAWLRKVDNVSVPETAPPCRNNGGWATSSHVALDGREQLRARLKTLSGPQTYFCQASELLNATNELSRWERFGKSFGDVRAGNCSSLEMARRIGIWLFWRIRRVFLGAYARGSNKSTPVGGINLQPGEWVEVKPMESITETLNESAHNRGLYFTPAMRLLCGEQHRVEKKVDKIIVDGTGEMRQLRNTVFLEGSLCGCACVAFGGCPRGEFAYWREIWLSRSGGLGAAKPLNRESWYTPERVMSTTGCMEKQ